MEISLDTSISIGHLTMILINFRTNVYKEIFSLNHVLISFIRFLKIFLDNLF
jgi:hypothetical protein